MTPDSLQNGGVGYHQAYLQFNYPWKIRRWLQELYALTFIYNFSAILPKLAILILYKRLFGTSRARYSIYALFTILSLYALILTVLELGTCWPIAANWDTIPGSRCLNKRVVATWITIPNIVTDIWMLILPTPIIWKLHAPKRLKIGLSFTFLVGSIGLIASIGRFIISLTTNSFEDGTWVAAELLIWIQVEPGAYLISACLPTLRPLLDKVAKTRFFKASKGTVSRVFGTKGSGNDSAARPARGLDIKLQPQKPASALSRNHSGRGFERLEDKGNELVGVRVVPKEDLKQNEVDLELGRLSPNPDEILGILPGVVYTDKLIAKQYTGIQNYISLPHELSKNIWDSTGLSNLKVRPSAFDCPFDGYFVVA
ncbi:hypothetical protein G7Y89_g5501 [Cudoniella acicularis]|uniref:Rhodopsin domain-containing protein n=1 Tax=Cudoniella acicularis TaxID=354080 RepID=A0A8H4W3X7_9HELO|nr:hypothetical protein G7Y89_g5501 [Cudoniella acicularis]